MCGIAGCLVAPGDGSGVVAVESMIAALHHRGPDDHGLHADRAAGAVLGHARLSIIDLSAAGRNPMFGEDGSVALVFNGEIYNFRALRGELEAAGHRFASRTDSEVLVHGYEEWGEAVLGRLEGMFAFAIWDARKKKLLLARDPMGIKPLYIHQRRDGAIFFASEMKAFRSIAGFRGEIDARSLRQYLEIGFVPDSERTSLLGVRKLPAGHVVTIHPEDVARRVRPEPRAYFQVPEVEPLRGVAGEAEERCERLMGTLEEVVKQHLVADVPVAILLSGGLDSSLVAAIAARQGPVRTLTMSFGESRVDEREFARIVAKRIGSHHEEIVIAPADIVADLEQTVVHFDDLFADWGVLSTRLLYQRCRSAGVKVVLVGEGSDELFGGYPGFALSASASTDGQSLLRRTLRLYQYYSGRRWGRTLPDFARTIRSLYAETGEDFFSAVRLFETRSQLPNNYNMKVDKASMAASVEARVPYLDVRVAREAFRTPRELLLGEGTNKLILRKVAEKLGALPPEISRRPKFGASIAATWMDEVPSFRAFARDVVLDPGGWAGPLGVRRAMESYFDGGQFGYRFPHPVSIFSILAWRLLLLNLWSRHFVSAMREPDAAAAERVA